MDKEMERTPEETSNMALLGDLFFSIFSLTSTVHLKHDGNCVGIVTKVPGRERTIDSVMEYIILELESISDYQFLQNKELQDAIACSLHSHGITFNLSNGSMLSCYVDILRQSDPTEHDLQVAAGLLNGRFLFLRLANSSVCRPVVRIGVKKDKSFYIIQ